MQDISQHIVDYIGQIREKCEVLVKDVNTPSSKVVASADM